MLWLVLWLVLCMVGLSVQTTSAQHQPDLAPTPIGVTLVDADRDFVPDRVGDTVTVGGRAVVASKVLRGDRLDVFLQDASGGIRLAAPASGPAIALGDSVVATGVIEHVAGLAQLAATAYRVVPAASRTLAPLPINLESAFLEHYEGRLGQIKGYVAGKGRVKTGRYMNIAVGDSVVVAFIYADNSAGAAFDEVQISDYVSITGVVGQYDQVPPYNASYQIYPRYPGDVRMAGIPPRLYGNLVLGVSVLLLAVLAWVYALRREVRRRIAQLKASEARYQMLFQHAGDALFVHDLGLGAASPLAEVNALACEVLGYSSAALAAHTLADLVPARMHEALDALIDTLRAEGQAVGEMVLTTGDQQEVPFEISSHVFRFNGRPTVLSIARDVTQRKAYEQGLIDAKQQAEALAQLKSAFVANMSHEIRTPLTAIIGFADVLSEEVEGIGFEVAGHIRESGKRLMDTLNSILDLSHLNAREVRLNPEAIDLIAEVQASVDLLGPLAEQKHLTLRFEAEQPALPAVQDRSCLHRIVNNLVGNAIKFTEQGEVTVSVSIRESRYRLTVQDTGIGIAATFMPHLFDEFKQESTGIRRSHEGSGLGLAITRRLVDMMDGEIDVASEKGKGTTFTVTAPLTLPGTDERLAA